MSQDKGHLFGDAVFTSDYWALQNADKDVLIRYTKTNGLEIAVGTPTQDSDIATKKYVDDKIGDLTSALEALL